MATSSKSRSSAPVLPRSLSFRRSISPSPQFSSSPSDPFSSAAASAFFSSSFAASCSSFTSSASSSKSLFQRPSSPTRVNLCSSPSQTPSVRIAINRSHSPSRSVSVRDQVVRRSNSIAKRTCMCSPTTHPGSFRCSVHRNNRRSPNNQSISCSPSRLNLHRSAMTNSLVRIGTVEGDWVKRALTALIRPSSHHQRRRGYYQPRPSRLSIMSKAGDNDL